MKTLKTGLALHEARLAAQKATKGNDKIISITVDDEGDFSVIDGDVKDAYARYQGGTSLKESPTKPAVKSTRPAPVIAKISNDDDEEEEEEDEQPVKAKSKKSKVVEIEEEDEQPVEDEVEVKKSSKNSKNEIMKTNKKAPKAAKVAAKGNKKAVKKTESKSTAGIKNQPMKSVVEFIQAKARTFDEIRKWLKKDGKQDSTIYAQINRLKNSPLLKIEGENVKAKK